MTCKRHATAIQRSGRKPLRFPKRLVAEYRDLDQMATMRNPEGELSDEQAQEIACLIRMILDQR